MGQDLRVLYNVLLRYGGKITGVKQLQNDYVVYLERPIEFISPSLLSAVPIIVRLTPK